MANRKVPALLLGSLLLSAIASAEMIPVPGSDLTFEANIVRTIGEQEGVKLRCTGVALREKTWLNVYAIGSYVVEDTTIKTAGELVAADIPKALLLKINRKVKGRKMARAFEKGINANYPKGTFENELKAFRRFFDENPVKKGDEVWFIHVPGKGVWCVKNKNEMQITSLGFSRAIWNIYFGDRHVKKLKEALILRL